MCRRVPAACLLPLPSRPAHAGPTNLVIVMEYCDAGTLKDVLRRGYFRRGVEPNGWPRLDLVVSA